jgi:ABC-type methionine transport system ATPase subunit
MAIARLADAKGATVALLPPTTAHRLAAISAPVEVVDHVLDRAVNGVIVPDGEVEEMFRNARNQRKQAKKKDRRSRVASASAYRRSEAGRRKEELCRLEREDQRKRSQEEASRIAADLIREIGSTGATRVVALMSSDIADDVLAELRKQLSPDEFDKQPSCEGATAGASA